MSETREKCQCGMPGCPDTLRPTVVKAFNQLNEMLRANLADPWGQASIIAACMAHTAIYVDNLDAGRLTEGNMEAVKYLNQVLESCAGSLVKEIQENNKSHVVLPSEYAPKAKA